MHLCRYNRVIANIIVFFPQAYALMLWSITGVSCHKYHYSRDKSMVFATKLYFCRSKTFVMTNISRDKHACHDKTFVATNTCLLRQKFCHDKHTFVATKDVFCLDKRMFAATNYKTFVPTKIILVAAPPMIVAIPSLSVQGSYVGILWTQKLRSPVLRTQSTQMFCPESWE